MAYTTTRAYVRTAARRRCDQVNSTFRLDTDINPIIDDTYAEVYEHIFLQQPERFLNSFPLTTIAGQNTYAITQADFYKMKDIEGKIGGRMVTLDMFQWQDRNRYQDMLGWDYAQPAAWRLYGNNIVFEPVPNGGFALTCWYHPAPIKFADDVTTVDMVAGWQEALIVGVAWKLALEEEDLELADRLGAEYQRQLQRILDFGAVRVTEHVEYARDIYKSDWEDRSR